MFLVNKFNARYYLLFFFSSSPSPFSLLSPPSVLAVCLSADSIRHFEILCTSAYLRPSRPAGRRSPYTRHVLFLGPDTFYDVPAVLLDNTRQTNSIDEWMDGRAVNRSEGRS